MDFLNALVVLANFVIIPGIAYGSTLALGALGITLIYGILRFSNFAHARDLVSLMRNYPGKIHQSMDAHIRSTDDCRQRIPPNIWVCMDCSFHPGRDLHLNQNEVCSL